MDRLRTCDPGRRRRRLGAEHLLPPRGPGFSGRDVERRHVEILERVKNAVTVPVAVKLSPYFSSTGDMVRQLDRAGADALVLFNRFMQPDIDPETLEVVPGVGLSRPAEARLPRTWIALLYGQVRAALAASTGVEDPDDLVKYLLAGADVVMSTSSFLRHGPSPCRSPARRAVRLDAPQGIRNGATAAREARVHPGWTRRHLERTGYVASLRAANTGDLRPVVSLGIGQLA